MTSWSEFCLRVMMNTRFSPQKLIYLETCFKKSANEKTKGTKKIIAKQLSLFIERKEKALHKNLGKWENR